MSAQPDSVGSVFPEDRRAVLAAWLIWAMLTAGVVFLIVLRPDIDAEFDQTFIGYHFSHGYPHFESGIVADLLVGLINSVVPFDSVSSNTIVRSFAAVFYMAAAGLLAWSLTGAGRIGWYVGFLLLVVTARFPFLWLSIELFAGAFMMLLLWGLVRERSFVALAFLLVPFALFKPDLALPGVLLATYLVLRPEPMARWQRAMIMGGLAAILVVPSLFADRYYERFGGRAMVSFRQHYGELVRPHQLGEAPPGFGEGLRYVRSSFPGADSVPEIVLGYPAKYLDFVALSVTESVVRIIKSKLVILVVIAAFLFTRAPPSWRIATVLLLSSLIPTLLLAFMHIRYQARYYPLALFVIFAGLFQGSRDPRTERIVAAALGLLFLWQAVDLVPVLETAYWFPD